jgi:hypothetical protein
VLDLLSVEYNLSSVEVPIYYIEEKLVNSKEYVLLISFENNSAVYHTVDYNIGSYFDLDYLRLRNLGKNIYIYKISDEKSL